MPWRCVDHGSKNKTHKTSCSMRAATKIQVAPNNQPASSYWPRCGRSRHGVRKTNVSARKCPDFVLLVFAGLSLVTRVSFGKLQSHSGPNVSARKCPDYVLLVFAGLSLVTRVISERRHCDRQDGGSKQTVPQRKSAPRHSQTAPLIKAIMSPTMACNRRAILFENTSTVGQPLRRV